MPKGDNFKWKSLTHKRWKPSPRWLVTERIAQVGKLIIQWYQRYEIVAIWEKKRSISATQVDRYIKRANERIRAKNEITLEDELKLIEAQIMDIYQWARREKKWWDASRALKLKIDLKWLDAPKKIKIWELDPEDEAKVDELMEMND